MHNIRAATAARSGFGRFIAARFFHAQLYAPVGAEGLAYAQRRGMTRGTLTRFGIGFAPNSWSALVDAMRAKGYTDQELRDGGLVSEKNGRIFDRFRNRLMFPIIDVRGNVIGFGGRVMDDSTPKYLNSPETDIFNKRKNLFGLNLAKRSKLGYLILVEGYMDAIALHQHGFDCAVASLGTSLTQEHAALLSRYTEQVVLIYDGDDAGQNATRRAIPMLEAAGIGVKVLRMRDAKDPDEFLRKFGADRFKVLLEEASNRVEYQLGSIMRKYDLENDEQRVKFVREAAEMISTLNSPVQREVYGGRAAEAARISMDAMKLEIKKAFQRRMARERKKREQQELAPAQALQPKSRAIRYDNIKSAMAEETVIAMVLKEPGLLEQTKGLQCSEFSSPLLGRIYEELQLRYRRGLEVAAGVLEDLSEEEMSHLAGIVQRHQEPVKEAVLEDCIRIIQAEHRAGQVSSEEDLMALREKFKEQKGMKS